MSVIKADRSQPEFSRPVWEYLDGALSPLRVRNGQRLLEQNAELLSRIEQRYGVDRQALVSVWGMESNFGSFGATSLSSAPWRPWPTKGAARSSPKAN